MTGILEISIESEIERLLKKGPHSAIHHFGEMACDTSNYSLEDRKKIVIALSQFREEKHVGYAVGEIRKAALQNDGFGKGDIGEFAILTLKDINHDLAVEEIYNIGDLDTNYLAFAFETLVSIDTDESSKRITDIGGYLKYARPAVQALKERGTIAAAEGLKKLGGLYTEPCSIIDGLLHIRQKFNVASDLESAQKVESLVWDYVSSLTQSNEIVSVIKNTNPKRVEDIRVSFTKVAKLPGLEGIVEFYDEAIQAAKVIDALEAKREAIFALK